MSHAATPVPEAPRASNLAAARDIVDALIARGLHRVSLSAGSRSTPLVLACAERSELELTTHVDERSAGFFALGLARETGRPVAIVCTSGSALSNLHPAVTEAFYGGVGLVLLTADRPARLQGCGAPQTIAQPGLFAPHVAAEAHFEIPATAPDLAEVDRCWRAAAAGAPVHLNVAFDEPLVPEDQEVTRPRSVSASPDPRAVAGPAPVDESAVLALAPRLSWRRGVIVAGPDAIAEDGPNAGAGLRQFLRKTGVPVIADPLSGVRGWVGAGAPVIDAGDAMFRSARVRESMRPSWILRLGRTPTSKAVRQWLAATNGEQIVIGADAKPTHPRETVTGVIRGEPDATLACLALAVSASPEAAAWADRFSTLQQTAQAVIDAHLEAAPWWYEGRVVRALAHAAPTGTRLFAASSMPIREVDTFLPESSLRVRANRGANGIDGQVSTALGIAAAAPGAAYALLGDLALLHDLGGLHAARLLERGAVLVVINNDGGGIFGYLPVADVPNLFESHFVLPHGLDFSHAAAQFGLDYVKPENPGELTTALRPTHEKTSRLVEVRVPRKESTGLHQQLWNDIAHACEEVLAE